MRYQVIVGNVGTVIDTNKAGEAVEAYNAYVEKSKNEQGRRCGGEAVTLFEAGNITQEHLGYQWIFENYGGDIQYVMGRHRVETPGLCPVCSCHTEVLDNKIEVAVNGDDERILLKCQCTGCGFKFKDVLRVVGVELEEE